MMLITLTGCVKGPEILIGGVEEGKMYATKRTITIDEEKAGTYIMQLNGNEINSGYEVTKNGHYQLTVSSKKWWKETEEKLNFTIDNRPPNAPSFKEAIQPGYFQEATFELQEEEGVTYHVKLNGKPYNLHTPIRETGEYELDILAKKENGKVAHLKETFFVDHQTFTQKDIDTFLLFHFDEDTEQEMIYKWIGEVVPVYVHGNPTQEDRKQLNTFLAGFNEWLPVQFEVKGPKDINYTDYQIDVHFVPNEQFKEHGFTEELIQGNTEYIGFAMPTEGDNIKGLLKTTIGVDTDITQKVRNTALLHEFVHALGMYNHFEADKSSILYPRTDYNVLTLNETDRKMIEMLYRKDVRPGMTKEEILKLWEPRITQ